MDAPNVVSLSAAVGLAVPEALLEEMRRAEAAEMYAADLESRFAQRHFVANLQTNPRTRPRTWASLFRMAWVTMEEVHRLIFRAIGCLRRNRIDEARVLLIEAEYAADFDGAEDPMSEDDVDTDDMV